MVVVISGVGSDGFWGRIGFVDRAVVVVVSLEGIRVDIVEGHWRSVGWVVQIEIVVLF